MDNTSDNNPDVVLINVDDENNSLINFNADETNTSVPLNEIMKSCQTRHLVVLNVLALVDYFTFKKHLATTKVRTKTKIRLTIKNIFEKLNSHYTSIESGKYKYIIKLKQVVICTIPEKLPYKNADYGYYEKYLDYMETLLIGEKYDAALAFTYRRRNGMGGLAKMLTLGMSNAHAVVRLTDVLTSANLAAHELAHVIGVDHDDASIISDGIMLPHVPDVDVKFSNSSIQQMAVGIDIFKARKMQKF